MNLFQTGVVKLHSGGHSNFKIDCDALTDEDIYSVALQLTTKLPIFGIVVGIPTGGLKLAEALRKYAVPESNNRLIVDDVFTTGASMEEFRKLYLPIFHPFIFGAVIFARSETPDWVTPLFRME